MLSKPQEYTPSLFQNHLLKVHSLTTKLHVTEKDYLPATILLILFIAFVWIVVSNSKQLNQLIKGFYLNNHSHQLSRDDYSARSSVSVILFVVFVFVIALFFLKFTLFFQWNFIHLPQPAIFPVMVVVLFAVYLFKLASIHFLGSVFELSKAAAEYRNSVLFFCYALGLCMLPMVICLFFVKKIPSVYFIYAGFSIIIFFFFFRIIKGIKIGMSNSKVSVYYLFLYFCTLEIMPLAIFAKCIALLKI